MRRTILTALAMFAMRLVDCCKWRLIILNLDLDLYLNLNLGLEIRFEFDVFFLRRPGSRLTLTQRQDARGTVSWVCICSLQA